MTDAKLNHHGCTVLMVLRKTMERIGNGRDLYKQLIETGTGDTLGDLRAIHCRVHWSYSMFMEMEEYTFDSSRLRTSETDELLPGIVLALLTMRKGKMVHSFNLVLCVCVRNVVIYEINL